MGHGLEILIEFLAAVTRVSLPLVFVACGGIYSERSGVINIALEGLMIAGAFGAAVGTLMTHSPYVGWVMGGVFGILVAALYAYLVIHQRTDQIVTGTAVNMLMMGLIPFISKIYFGNTTSLPHLQITERLFYLPWFFVVLVVFVSIYILNRTPLGLWIQFAGEKPEALNSAGISVFGVRWFSVLYCGLLSGWGGATLSIYLSSTYTREMTAGRGYMALAALIFGRWKPVSTLFACILFGMAEALQIRLQGVIIWGTEPVPVQWIQILPYVLTVFVLAGWGGKARAPRSLGLPFIRA